MIPNRTYRPSSYEVRKWHLAVEALAAGVLICLFTYTALDKLYNLDRFKDALEKSPLLSGVAGMVSWLLPIAELLIAIALFIPAMRKKGFTASVVVLTVFTIYLSYMIAFAPKLPCMCAGLLESLSWKSHIAFNIILIVLAVLGNIASGKCTIDATRAPP